MQKLAIIFFFSSRRRHTSWNCDLSSDVCSSDLVGLRATALRRDQVLPVHAVRLRADDRELPRALLPREGRGGQPAAHLLDDRAGQGTRRRHRSEERRVGKECRSRWWAEAQKKKT